MEMKDLEKDLCVCEWFSLINGSKNTKNGYLTSMHSYTEFTGKSPAELINEAEEDIDNNARTARRKIKRSIMDFRQHLQNNGLAATTVQSYVVGVRSFYAAFEIEVPKLGRSERSAAPKEENLPIPSKQDLQEALKVCDLLEKAVILTGVSSGLSSVDIAKLTSTQFNNGYDENTGITTLQLRRTKTRYDFITFLSPECSQAVRAYLAYRERTVKTSTFTI